MEYQELIAAAEANLKAKNILKNYSVGEGIHYRQGTETNHANCSSREYFERLAFKFRLIDSEEASTDITLFNRKFKTPILSAALSSMGDVAEKPLIKVASGIKNSGSMMWLGILPSEQFKEVVESGVPTVKIVKPYRDTQAMIGVERG